MAGELLFRILDRQAYERLSPEARVRSANVNAAFLDGGDWSLTRGLGPHSVVIDGSAFYVDAPWMYEGHHAFDELSLRGDETATLLLPRDVVVRWRARLQSLPDDGEVARTSPAVRDALIAMMDVVVASDALELTVQCLL